MEVRAVVHAKTQLDLGHERVTSAKRFGLGGTGNEYRGAHEAGPLSPGRILLHFYAPIKKKVQAWNEFQDA